MRVVLWLPARTTAEREAELLALMPADEVRRSVWLDVARWEVRL